MITIGLIRSLHNKDGDVAGLWETTMKERTGYTFTEIVARRRSDRAARGITGVLRMKEMETCEMHDT